MRRAALRFAILMGAVAAIGVPALSTGNAASTSQVVRAVVPLGAKTAPATVLGSLMPGLAVNVVSSATPAGITLTAWYAGSASAVLVTKPGERIVVARLTPAGIAAAVPGATQKDDNGTIWHEVSIGGLVDATQLAPDEATVFHEAPGLYGTHCSTCHTLHQPGDYTANQWPGIFASMQIKAALTDDQAALILAYLQRNAKSP